MIEILKHMLYKSSSLSLILTTERKLQSSHKEPRWQGWGGGACSGSIWWESAWHQAWVTSVRSQEGGGKLWAWPQLHGSKGIKIILEAEHFERPGMWGYFSSSHYGLPVTTRTKSPPLNSVTKLSVTKNQRVMKGSIFFHFYNKICFITTYGTRLIKMMTS